MKRISDRTCVRVITATATFNFVLPADASAPVDAPVFGSYSSEDDSFYGIVFSPSASALASGNGSIFRMDVEESFEDVTPLAVRTCHVRTREQSVILPNALKKMAQWKFGTSLIRTVRLPSILVEDDD